MAVYVDDVEHRYGRMKMCHMWADTKEEMLEMADRLGIARKWIQQPPKASWLHFDISKGKRRQAIDAGAILTDKYGPLLHCALNPEWPNRHSNILTPQRIARIRERDGLMDKYPRQPNV